MIQTKKINRDWHDIFESVSGKYIGSAMRVDNQFHWQPSLSIYDRLSGSVLHGIANFLDSISEGYTKPANETKDHNSTFTD